MARQDIVMDAEYGKVGTSGNIAGKSFCNFCLFDAVTGTDNDTFHYGEITAPVGFVYTCNGNEGFHVKVPYTPDIRRLTVCLIMESGPGDMEHLRNPTTGKHWFPVVTETEAGTANIALAISFFLNEKGVYNPLSQDGHLAVHSGSGTDFGVGAVRAQNEAFLLKISARNLYQHSMTGVSLVDYLYSSLENNGFVTKLQSGLPLDKITIKNAYMDSATGELLLGTEEKEENDG